MKYGSQERGIPFNGVHRLTFERKWNYGTVCVTRPVLPFRAGV